VLLRRAEYDDAKARFRRALEIAQNMQARAWELRAAIGLAHVLRKEGHAPEAHQLLAPIYAWYTEGLETRDLGQAKALLHQLAASE
jgi:predicted ATPase